MTGFWHNVWFNPLIGWAILVYIKTLTPRQHHE